MSEKFTPGPWEWRIVADFLEICRPGDKTAFCSLGVAPAPDWPVKESTETEANARLIAAAPDLYRALAAEVAVRARLSGLAAYQCGHGYPIGDPGCDCVDCGRHRASVYALAKARGETP